MGIKIVRPQDCHFEKIERITSADVRWCVPIPDDEVPGAMSVGFWKQQGGPYETSYTWDEVTYVIDGPIEMESEGQKYVANTGDVIIAPKGSKFTLGNKDSHFAALFVTFPHMMEALAERERQKEEAK